MPRCVDCQHEFKAYNEKPCKTCSGYSNFAPKVTVEAKKMEPSK